MEIFYYFTVVKDNPILRNDYERVCRGEPLSVIDTTRYKLEIPTGPSSHQLTTWKSSIDNAYAQYEHQNLR